VAMVRQNPAMLAPLLEELSRSNPQLLQFINQNQQAFQEVLNGTAAPAAPPVAPAAPAAPGGGPPPGQVPIRVTQEEADAIERLQALGFPKEAALQAYLACDKNEQLAANLLFDGKGD